MRWHARDALLLTVGALVGPLLIDAGAWLLWQHQTRPRTR